MNHRRNIYSCLRVGRCFGKTRSDGIQYPTNLFPLGSEDGQGRVTLTVIYIDDNLVDLSPLESVSRCETL